MNFIDIIFLIIMAACVVTGAFKGIITQAFTIIGIIVVATLTATVAPYVQNWLANAIPNENLRNVLSMVLAAVIIAAVYGVVAVLLKRVLKKVEVIGVLDHVLGAVMGFVVVYLGFAVIFALFNETAETFMPGLKKLVGDKFAGSWVGQHLYANNFFGRWIIVGIAQKLMQSITPAA